MAGRVAGTCCTASVERAGLPGLLRDLQRLAEDQDSADILFILGNAEEKVYAHKIILIARCKSFQNTKRGEICRMPGCVVTSSAGGTTPIRLPHVQPETFRLFMQYVYTGKLLLQDSGVFEMMTLAADLGVEDLRSACEDHVTSTLNVENACTLLAAAMDIQDRPGGKSASSFMERCISFIEENAPECVKSNAFLNLPKEALIKLISSDNLRLEEKDVWRCSLAWAKQRAGVTQPTAHWAEEERARVIHHLTPLMQHVRLLHIDSVVFAEEVEPTGAVPMELSLKRYKSAALHATPHAAPPAHDARRRTQPRLATNFFVDSVILRQDKIAFQSLLNTWCGAPSQSWRLVFRASTHGFSAHAFHSRCDAIAPVLLLLQLPRGEIIGGFSTSGWSAPAGGETTAGGYIAAERALLFTQDPPAVYPLMKNSFALCYHSECGPIFGAGADLLVSHNSHCNSDSYSNLHSYGDVTTTTSPHASLVPDYNFTVRDYEIFTY